MIESISSFIWGSVETSHLIYIKSRAAVAVDSCSADVLQSITFELGIGRVPLFVETVFVANII